LQLLLFEAERAWAYSRELSHLATLPANKEKVPALKRNATSRFRRAVNWATQLLSHCQSLYASSRLSANGLIQATVYTLILNGRFLRYRFDFEDALVQLSVAKALLGELAA
jgi:signal recognition particle subunit SRP68